MAIILTYHSIDSSASVLSTSPERFRRQMSHLRSGSFPVVPLSEIARTLRDGADVPPEAVAITFDDGYRNFYEEAFPVLQEYGYPATVFLVAGLCGAVNQWEKAGSRVPSLNLLEWPAITEMARHGVDFGAHSMTHPDLSRMEAPAAREEVTRSKQVIEERLGRRVDSFAWPYGRSSPELLRLVREVFAAVCTVTMDFVTRDSSRHALPRIEMYYFSRNDRFSQLGTGAFARYVWLRRSLRSVRGTLVSD